MSQAKLKCFKTCAAIVLVLVVICQCVGAIKSNYSIGFENVQTRGGGNHGNHGRYNSSHSGHGSGHGGHKNVFNATPVPRSHPTFPTNMHIKPNRTAFGHSNSNHSNHGTHNNSHTGPGSRGGGHSKVSGTTPEPKVSPTSSTKFNPKSNGTSNNSSGNNHTGPGSRGGGHSNVSSTTPEPGNNATVTHPPSGPTSANKTRPSTNSGPLIPPEPQEPMLLPGNGTKKIIYFDQKLHKNSSDWDAFDLIVTYLRNISSNANKHKKQTQIINGEKIQHYYVTRDYYHNSHNVPKTMEENEDRLKPCAVDATKIWCVPCSYSMCSDNRIMCVAYMSQTVSCGNHTCARTKYPRDKRGKNPSCADDDLSTYIPCVSHMKLHSTPTADIFTHTHIDFCILSIIEAIPLESPVAAITNLFFELGKSHINTIRSQNITYK